jgi:hypothetical protein
MARIQEHDTPPQKSFQRQPSERTRLFPVLNLVAEGGFEPPTKGL